MTQQTKVKAVLGRISSWDDDCLTTGCPKHRILSGTAGFKVMGACSPVAVTMVIPGLVALPS